VRRPALGRDAEPGQRGGAVRALLDDLRPAPPLILEQQARLVVVAPGPHDVSEGRHGNRW
jgi:hypothetical protein